MPGIFEELALNLYDGGDQQVARLVRHALDEGHTANDILHNGLIAGMDRVGVDFKVGDLFVPEVLVAARAMRAGLDVLRPLLAEGEVSGTGTYVIGTIQGDLHDIGKNLVKMMLEGAGFKVVDLGTDVRVDEFVSAVREHQPDVLGMSALLTTTMANMRLVIEALERAGLRDSVKVMIGGAPVTGAFATQIGADAYAPDAASAVDVARGWV